MKKYFLPFPGEPDRIIGVLPGLGSSWIVGHVDHNGAHRRYKSPKLPAQKSREKMQAMLDDYAAKYGLLSVANVIPEELIARELSESLYKHNVLLAMPWRDMSEGTRKAMVDAVADLTTKYKITSK